jgi:hypothetical protein
MVSKREKTVWQQGLAMQLYLQGRYIPYEEKFEGLMILHNRKSQRNESEIVAL